jgi:ribosome recycling factor
MPDSDYAFEAIASGIFFRLAIPFVSAAFLSTGTARPLLYCLEGTRRTMASFMDGIPALKTLSGDLRRRMDQAVATFQANLASTRTGRASVHMLDQVKVDYYGTPTPISQVGQVSTPEPQLIVISPWDPTILKDIEKAITIADLGLNPQSDGKVIRIPVPPMTEERRRDICKHLNKLLEEHRTAIRNVRRDGNDAMKKLAKEKKISEDEEKRSQEEVQKMTDEEIRRMEELCRKKEAEVMQV